MKKYHGTSKTKQIPFAISLFALAVIVQLGSTSINQWAEGQTVQKPEDLIIETKTGTVVKGATTIDGKKAKELFDRGVVFIDFRLPHYLKKDGIIPGAIHFMEKDLNRDGLLKIVKPDQEVVFYCGGFG